MIVTFCGHREVQEPEKVRKWLLETVERLIMEGADCFYLGGYGQFDTIAADVIRELKQKYKHIKSVLVLPYIDREYDSSGYDESIYPPLEIVPRRYAISKRNEYMVDNADIVIAYVIFSFGGAYSSLCYSERKRKRIIRY
ncbi:MAG: DUF1273 family protein [Clostridia bacterium]|nr:DUF1273 family protein [Clostridia bacterium]